MEIKFNLDKASFTRVSASRASKTTNETRATNNQDSVQISNASSEVLASEAPFNADKIAQIKQAIANGDYEINAQAIAEKLMLLENK